MAYALFGVSVAGGVPILLPLTVIRSGTAGQIGMVIAAMNLGSIAAPLWGELADRWRVHRALLAGGLVVTAAAVAAFA
ncbi:MAG TPA: MFS transporter, partial [bacterium]|nr:MFS transporter [bacterium]